DPKFAQLCSRGRVPHTDEMVAQGKQRFAVGPISDEEGTWMPETQRADPGDSARRQWVAVQVGAGRLLPCTQRPSHQKRQTQCQERECPRHGSPRLSFSSVSLPCVLTCRAWPRY